MAQFLDRTEMDMLEIFHLKTKVHQGEIDLLKEQDLQRGLRAQALTEKMTALKWEIESLRLPDKKIWDRLMSTQTTLEKVKAEHRECIKVLKEKYNIPDEEDLGYDPSNGQIITREEARLSLDDWELENSD